MQELCAVLSRFTPGERNFHCLNREEGFIKLSRWVWWQKIGTGSRRQAKCVAFMEGMVAGCTETYRTCAQNFKRHVQDNGNLFHVIKMYIVCVCHLFLTIVFSRIRMIVE